jgi:1-acyl-sn-glycerol-3-phosphate acyltransferase
MTGPGRIKGRTLLATLSIARTSVDPGAVMLCAARSVFIAVPLFILLPLHLLWQAVRMPSPWAMLYLRIVSRVLGMRVKVHGERLTRNVFFAANHISWHDIPVLGGITGTAFVAQDGVRKWPIIGWLAAQNRTIFVSRTEKQNVGGQIAELRAAIAENWSVTLFPEGTTSDGSGLLPFKPSLFATLAPPPKPIMIQPIWLDFSEGRDVAWLGVETGWESAWRAFTRPGSFKVGVHFLEPFDPALLGCRKQVCAEVRDRLLAAMRARCA